MTKNSFLSALSELGQSIWYDNLSIDVLQSGELASLVQQGVTGLTSNPTIFKMAIADTNNYDQKISKLISKGLTTEELTEELMIDDVGAAADLLLDTYERTRGADGYASIEVSPDLADDTAGTVSAALRLYKRLNRPNIMIKIPATTAGIPAIEKVLRAGINVNVTLIFSVDVYKEVVGAYLAALRSLEDPDKLSQIASVASFFVSRVDAAVEKKLADTSLSSAERAFFLGGIDGKSSTVGIANSKAAYAYFEQVFNGSDFSALAAKGARVQRPLWASTGVKNPALPELLYVEALIGADTVNTLPPKTLKVLLKDCTVLPTVNSKIEESTTMLEKLALSGISLPAILSDLQEAGVKAFQDSYRDLLSAVADKQKKLAA